MCCFCFKVSNKSFMFLIHFPIWKHLDTRHQSFLWDSYVFASDVSFEIYACSVLTDFFIFDGDGSNELVLDSKNFLFTDFLFDSVFASVLETVKKLMVLHFCVVNDVDYQVLQ